LIYNLGSPFEQVSILTQSVVYRRGLRYVIFIPLNGALFYLLKQLKKFCLFRLQGGLGGWVAFAKNLSIGLSRIEVYCFVCVLATYRLPFSIDIIAGGSLLVNFALVGGFLSLISIKYVVSQTDLLNLGSVYAYI
jgi:hypothetical protein